MMTTNKEVLMICPEWKNCRLKKRCMKSKKHIHKESQCQWDRLPSCPTCILYTPKADRDMKLLKILTKYLGNVPFANYDAQKLIKELDVWGNTDINRTVYQTRTKAIKDITDVIKIHHKDRVFASVGEVVIHPKTVAKYLAGIGYRIRSPK